MREAVGLIARFGLVGLVNTAIGFAVVLLLDPILGVPPALANAVEEGSASSDSGESSQSGYDGPANKSLDDVTRKLR